MELNKLDGMIFDLDDTLIDSENVWTVIDTVFFGKRGLDLPDNYAKLVSTMNLYEAAVFTKNMYSLPDTPEEMMSEWADLALEQYTHNVKALPGAKEYLELLRSQGKKIALATASNVRLYTAVLKSNGLYDYFDCFVSTEDVSRGKGFPDVYLAAAERLSLAPDRCAVFEDKIECIRAAKSGGFTVAACMYRAFDFDAEAMRTEADAYFHDYTELLI